MDSHDLPVVRLPEQNGIQRLETGPLQVGDDWPGVFIRGDAAAYYAIEIKRAIEIAECNDPGNAFVYHALRKLAEILRSCLCK